jgi:putative acetyltransferase
MALLIEREPADSEEAVRLLKARDAELDSLYPPESRFSIPVEKHIDQNLIFLMARENGTPVGTGVLSLHSRYAELKSMYVVPEARGHRVGAAIVAALERGAVAAGYGWKRVSTRRPRSSSMKEQVTVAARVLVITLTRRSAFSWRSW